MMNTSTRSFTNAAAKFTHGVKMLPPDIKHEILLFTLDPYTEDRKKLMRAVRREGIRKIMVGARIPHPRAWTILETDGTINELINEPATITGGPPPIRFHIPMGPWIKLRAYINLIQNNHRPLTDENQLAFAQHAGHTMWHWRRIVEIEPHDFETRQALRTYIDDTLPPPPPAPPVLRRS